MRPNAMSVTAIYLVLLVALVAYGQTKHTFDKTGKAHSLVIATIAESNIVPQEARVPPGEVVLYVRHRAHVPSVSFQLLALSDTGQDQRPIHLGPSIIGHPEKQRPLSAQRGAAQNSVDTILLQYRQDYANVFELTEGRYKLQVADHPQWSFVLTVDSSIKRDSDTRIDANKN